jgi:hypothetical protein
LEGLDRLVGLFVSRLFQLFVLFGLFALAVLFDSPAWSDLDGTGGV